MNRVLYCLLATAALFSAALCWKRHDGPSQVAAWLEPRRLEAQQPPANFPSAPRWDAANGSAQEPRSVYPAPAGRVTGAVSALPQSPASPSTPRREVGRVLRFPGIPAPRP
ncbi:MAG: hypothetical protein N2C14_10500, partial [Planctomycetales bacterium]